MIRAAVLTVAVVLTVGAVLGAQAVEALRAYLSSVGGM